MVNKVKLDFSQIDDTFKVYFNETYPKNTSLILNIDYEGLTSQRYFAGEKAVYLTSNYGLLPYPGKSSVFYEEEGMRINTTPLENTNKINYHLKIKHNSDKILSNLKLSDNILSGKSTGVSLLIGNMTSFTEGDNHYYYSYTFEDKMNREQLINLLKKYNKISNDIEEILKIEKTSFNKIIAIPYTNYDSRSIYQIEANKSDNILFWSGNEDIKDTYIVDSALANITYSNLNFVTQSALAKRYFYELLQSWIYKQNNYSLEEQFDEKSLNKTKDKLYLAITDELLTKNNSEAKMFFSNWFEKMCSDKKMTLDDIKKLIN
jgi:hypothetical protein